MEQDKIINDPRIIDSITNIQSTLETIISGVKPREVKKAVRNHIRDHLTNLIYGNNK